MRKIYLNVDGSHSALWIHFAFNTFDDYNRLLQSLLDAASFHSLATLELLLPVTLLCDAEKGKMSLVYRGLKMFDGHSMFKPLKQDGVKYVAVSIATGVKSKTAIQ
ncbi:hypothetical protein AV530_016622 [Patagioenas fasciata monilis]|uniref:Uncharacterized protein n=1 Tax=Patagioenas fasciata monilis TaxID=372326 RepID=A0A1V4J3K3_PATFA|nr:hypothetical protein AV530_016622 [Patagioenas fasciata monilis]